MKNIFVRREELMKEQLHRISKEKGYSDLNMALLSRSKNSDTWKYEFYYGSPEYHNPDEFGEITVGTK